MNKLKNELKLHIKLQFVLGPVIGSRSDATSIKAVKVRSSYLWKTMDFCHSSSSADQYPRLC